MTSSTFRNSTLDQTYVKFRKLTNTKSNKFSDTTATSTNVFTSQKFYMSSFSRSHSSINIFNVSKKKPEKTETTIYLPMVSSALNQDSNKLNTDIKRAKKLVINWKARQKSIEGNFLKFDKSLSALNVNEVTEKNKKKVEERIKQIKELHFDYDKKNANIIVNSFSGNNPNMLRNKVLFVKNVFDYIYPRILINRMKFCDKKNVEEIDNKIKVLKENFSNDYYKIKYRTVEENAKKSKYDLKGAAYDEAVKIKGNLINLNKIFVNGKLKTKLTKTYDFYE